MLCGNAECVYCSVTNIRQKLFYETYPLLGQVGLHSNKSYRLLEYTY